MADDFGARLGEREMLTGFLDWYRSIVEQKVDGRALSGSIFSCRFARTLQRDVSAPLWRLGWPRHSHGILRMGSKYSWMSDRLVPGVRR